MPRTGHYRFLVIRDHARDVFRHVHESVLRALRVPDEQRLGRRAYVSCCHVRALRQAESAEAYEPEGDAVSGRHVGPLDMAFLTAAQAFGAISRIGVDNQEISDDQLEEKLQKNRSSNLSRKMKNWVCYKLKGAKWKTANRLADDLLSSMEAITTRVVPDPERHKSDHRRHGDSITHRRSLGEDVRLSNEELFWHTGAVKVLTYAAIAKLLGITNEEFLERMKASGYLSAKIAHAATMYAVKKDAKDA